MPRIVELLPSVSDEIMDNGRGMTSTVSEKPTRGRPPGALSRRRRGEEVRDLSLEPETGGLVLGLMSAGKNGAGTVSDGVEGAEPARCLATAFALISSEASMPEIDTASDRRCRCLPDPEPETGGPGGLMWSALLGLVLTIVGDVRWAPSLPPPTNSLPRRRWPPLLAVELESPKFVFVGLGDGCNSTDRGPRLKSVRLAGLEDRRDRF